MQYFLNCYTNIFLPNMLGICAFICKKNMKGWSHKKIIFYFFCKFDLPRKKLENSNFMGAALLCANISQIFFLNWIIKNICCCLSKNLFNWSLHFFTSFNKPAGMPTDSFEKVFYNWDGFQLVPKYQSKVKLISNISVWNALISKKWKPRCVFLNFQFP